MRTARFLILLPVCLAASVRASADTPMIPGTNKPLEPSAKVAESPYEASPLKLPALNADDPGATYGRLKAIAIREHTRAEDFERSFNAVIGLNNKQLEIDNLAGENDRLKSELTAAKKEDEKNRSALNKANATVIVQEAKITEFSETGKLYAVLAILFFCAAIGISAVSLVRGLAYRKMIRKLEAELRENKAMLKEQTRMAGERFDTINTMKLAELAAAAQHAVALKEQVELARREAEMETARLTARNRRLQGRLDEAEGLLAFHSIALPPATDGAESGEIQFSRAEPSVPQRDEGSSADVKDAFGIHPDEGAQEPSPPDIVVAAGADAKRGTVAAMPAASDGAPCAEQILASRRDMVGPPDQG